MRIPMCTGLGLVVALSTGGVSLGQVFSGTLGPEAVGATGTGTAVVTLDPVAHTLRVQVNFSGLSSVTTNAHIHAPTASPFTGTAGVVVQPPTIAGFPLGVTAGTYDMTFDTSLASTYNATFINNNGGTPLSAEAALAGYMAAGRAYFNIHTSNFGGGEIRAFLPEPTMAVALMAGIGLLSIRRRAVRR